MSSHEALVTTQIQRMRDELETIIKGSIPQLEPRLELLSDLLNTLERIATTSPQDTSHLMSDLRGYAAKFMHFVSVIRDSIADLEHQVVASDRAREETQDRLREARAEQRTADDQHAREIVRLKKLLDELEEVVTGGGDVVLKKARALAIRLIRDLDQALGDTQRFEESARDLVNEAHNLFTTGSVTLATLEARITELSQQTAPLRAHRLRLDADALASLEAHIIAFDAVQTAQKELAEELQLFHSLEREWIANVDAANRAYRDLLRRLDAIALIFPDMGLDLFTLGNTTATQVNEKRRVLTALQLPLSHVRSALEQTLADREQALERQTARVEEQRALLEPLRTALSASVEAYQGLTAEEQRIARGMVLCFNGDPRDKLSEPTITFMVVAANIVEGAGSGDRALALLASLPFFRKTGRSEFKMHALTDDGNYWLKRWMLEEPELAACVRGARERADIERLAKAEETERRRQQTEAERHAREAARLDPVRIYNQLGARDREVLGAIALQRELPHHRNMIAWSRTIAAGRVAGLITAKNARALPGSLKRLLLHDPPLFELRRGTEGGTMLTLSSTGRRVCDMLPMPGEAVVTLFDGLTNHATKEWPNAAAVKIFRETQQAFEPLVHEIPADAHTLRDDDTQP